MQVGAVHDAGVFVAELALEEQRQRHLVMAHVGHGEHQLAARRRARLQQAQGGPGIGEVLEHVGEDHQVVVLPGHIRRRRFERSHPDLAQAGFGVACRCVVELDAVAGADDAFAQQSGAEHAGGATDIERRAEAAVRAQEGQQLGPLGGVVLGDLAGVHGAGWRAVTW